MKLHKILWILLPALLVFTQLSSQEDNVLVLNSRVQGQIESPGDEDVWVFSGLRDEMISIIVDATGDFDPVVALRMAGTTEQLIANDDYNYPATSNALLEGISIPRTGTYEIVVSGFEDSTGQYTLTMLPGYAEVAFDAAQVDEWQTDGALESNMEDGQLSLNVTGVQEQGDLSHPDLADLDDFYVQIQLQNISGREGWTVGLKLRHQPNGDHYLAAVDARGNWRLSVVAGDTERILRDWSPHPAIVPGETSFTLGVLVNDTAIDVFYNGQLLGRGTDVNISLSGAVDVLVMSADALGSTVTATLGSMLVTVPLKVEGENVLPDRLVPGNASLVVQELERRHFIPSGGLLAFSVTESFLEKRNPGVDILALGQGMTAANFALATTTIVTTFSEGTAACGLLFHSEDSTHYAVAYVDNSGAVGVSQRAGDTFMPGIFDESRALADQSPVRLLVVVRDGTLRYFVNDALVSTMELTTESGQVGNTAINFDPVESRCQFNDTWLWTWE